MGITGFFYNIGKWEYGFKNMGIHWVFAKKYAAFAYPYL